MDIVTYIEISVAIVFAYSIAVVASRWILRRCEEGTKDDAAEAEREAFRKWFRFANWTEEFPPMVEWNSIQYLER